MRAFVQIFSFDLVSKVLLGLINIALIRYMPSSEYARYTMALAVIVSDSRIAARCSSGCFLFNASSSEI
jgi:hypothetical protein